VSANETERPEDTVRRFARRLVTVEELVDSELARIATDDLYPARWWQFLRRKWRAGVFDARGVHADHLRKIREALG